MKIKAALAHALEVCYAVMIIATILLIGTLVANRVFPDSDGLIALSKTVAFLLVTFSGASGLVWLWTWSRSKG